MSKVNDTWQELFTQYNILENIRCNGEYEISATQIKPYYEPRLATKFDHLTNLPTVFSENGLAILPNSRGTYIIGDFEAYAALETPDTVAKKLPYLNLETLNPSTITSETLALNYAYATNALQDFIGEETLTPTVSGKMGSGEFSFTIAGGKKPVEIQVRRSQIEIDAGYECGNSLILVEAKNHVSDTFLVRQLYYPYRAWSSRISKPVRNIYATWVNGSLTLREYVFQNQYDYSSLELVKIARYVTSTDLSNRELYSIVKTVTPSSYQNVPYPQANSFERVINLIELCAQQDLSKETIAANYDFTLRQVDYYTNAAIFIGMIKKTGSGDNARYTLSGRGKTLLKKPYVGRQIELVKALAEDPIIRESILESLKRRQLVDLDFIALKIRENRLPLSENTIYRRAATVKNWVQWVLDLTA